MVRIRHNLACFPGFNCVFLGFKSISAGVEQYPRHRGAGWGPQKSQEGWCAPAIAPMGIVSLLHRLPGGVAGYTWLLNRETPRKRHRLQETQPDATLRKYRIIRRTFAISKEISLILIALINLH